MDVKEDKNCELQDITINDFERDERRLLSELAIKRDQVKELNNDLDSINLKLHQQTRALETAKNMNEEYQHNLTLALKNIRFLEDKMQVKQDFVSLTHFQKESTNAERESVRDTLQKTEMENYQLTRTMNEIKAQRNCEKIYQKELINRDVEINANIIDIQLLMKNLENKQNELKNFLNNIEIKLEDFQKDFQYYYNQCSVADQKFEKLQIDYIFVAAAIETYKNLSLENDHDLADDFECKIILNQWEIATNQFNSQLKKQKEIAENLTKLLLQEKDINAKLCLREADLTQQIKLLEKNNEKLTKEFNQNNDSKNDSETQTKINSENTNFDQ